MKSNAHLSSKENNVINSESEFNYTPIKVTASAANKVYKLMEEEGDLKLKLRVSITGGGCSGYQYHFAFVVQKEEDDMEISSSAHHENECIGQICVVVDPISLQYLAGAEIDYAEDAEGERFIIRNPNASTTCGCGSSFSME